jgi:hypothetical protein
VARRIVVIEIHGPTSWRLALSTETQPMATQDAQQGIEKRLVIGDS